MSAAAAPVPRWLNASGNGHRSNRLSPRAVCAVVTTTLLLVTSIISPGILPGAYQRTSQPPDFQCPVVPPTEVYVPSRRPAFDWRGLTAKYPVDGLTNLSDAPPRVLPQIQHRASRPSRKARKQREERKERVRDTFKRCWTAYREHAWLQDEVAPLSGTPRNPAGGRALTLVSSLDTLLLMGMNDDYETAAAAATDLDFGPETSVLEVVRPFDTATQYLASFLAAYDITGCRDARMLDKAVEVGDMLYASYDTPNRMPATAWNPRRAADGVRQVAASTGTLAELGTAGLELTRLSQLTGDMRYYDQATRIAKAMEEQQALTTLPGMWPASLNLRAMDLAAGHEYSLGDTAGRAYEYLPKLYSLLGATAAAEQYARMYHAAMSAGSDLLFQRPMLPDSPDVRVPVSVRVERDAKKMVNMRVESSACFSGGMLALGGKLFSNPAHVSLGRKVTEGCAWAYGHSKHGLAPEVFKMAHCFPDMADCAWNSTRVAELAVPGDQPPGFVSIEDPRYTLRPEAVESLFYLYRITGDERYQETAWDMFLAIENATSSEYGNALLRDVNSEEVEKMDGMGVRWMSETLKYFFLMFSESGLVSLDDFVFNTAGHPFRRPKR